MSENFDEQLEERRIFENQYFKVVAKADHLLKDKEEGSEPGDDNISVGLRTSASNLEARAVKCNIKLPLIKLPEFNG